MSDAREPVTIIMPIHQAASTVLRAVRSVLAQSMPRFRLVVVDDGSTDGGLDLVRALADERILCVSRPRLGVGAARNHALRRLVETPWVTFIDGDDEWYPHMLERALEIFERESGVAAVVQGVDVSHSLGGPLIDLVRLSRLDPLLDGRCRVQPDWGADRLRGLMAYVTTLGSVFRSDALLRGGGFAEGMRVYGGDTVAYLPVVLNESLFIDRRSCGIYHREASSLSRARHESLPLEAFLEKPDLVEAFCPPRLLPLLHGFFDLRRLQKARHYISFGQGKEARALLGQVGCRGPIFLSWTLWWGLSLFAAPLSRLRGLRDRWKRMHGMA